MTDRGRAVLGLPLVPLVPGRRDRGPIRRRRRALCVSLLCLTLGVLLIVLFRDQLLGHVAGPLWGADVALGQHDGEKLIGTLPARRDSSGSRKEGPRVDNAALSSEKQKEQEQQEVERLGPGAQGQLQQTPDQQLQQQDQGQEQTSTEQQQHHHEQQEGSGAEEGAPPGPSDAVSVRPGFAEAWKGREALEASEGATCHNLLEARDWVNATRNFSAQPVRVHNFEVKRWDCDVPCEFSMDESQPFDGNLGCATGTYRVMRSMEAMAYYVDNNPDIARKNFDIVMTVHYYSDVPVQYGSWEEYEIMRPLDEKDPSLGIAAAFISNCAANNFRLQALEELKKALKVDSYGRCGHNMKDANVDKQSTLNKYKFSLAFENSCEEDYVTEKFWQSLVAGAVPVVIGAPNIQYFVPNNHSYLQLKGVEDVERVAKEMMRIAGDNEAWRRMVDWKWKGPSVDFMANMDISTVHSSCRLCILIADKIVAKATEGKHETQPCRCLLNAASDTPSYMYHMYVRERFTFNYITVTLDSSRLSLSGLTAAVREAFSLRKHRPIWATKRPKSLATEEIIQAYTVYRIYPAGLNQKDVLHSDEKWFHSDEVFLDHLATHPCPHLEVIFV